MLSMTWSLKTHLLLLRFISYPMLLDISLDSVFGALSNGVFVTENMSREDFQKSIRKGCLSRNHGSLRVLEFSTHCQVRFSIRISSSLRKEFSFSNAIL